MVLLGRTWTQIPRHTEITRTLRERESISSEERGLAAAASYSMLSGGEKSIELIVGHPTTEEGFHATLELLRRFAEIAHFVLAVHSASADGVARFIVRR